MMVSVAEREHRAEVLYHCYQAETLTAPDWEKLSRTVQSKYERIASRYHERMWQNGWTANR